MKNREKKAAADNSNVKKEVDRLHDIIEDLRETCVNVSQHHQTLSTHMNKYADAITTQ